MELKCLTSEEMAAAPKDAKLCMIGSASHHSHYTYLAAIDSGCVIGCVTLYADLAKDNLHIESVNVARTNQGIATHLLQEVYGMASRQNKVVTSNGFTIQGQQYLVHIMQRLGQHHGVENETIGRF